MCMYICTYVCMSIYMYTYLYIYIWGVSFVSFNATQPRLPIKWTSDTFLHFPLWAQDHIMRPGSSYYRADMGPATVAPWALVVGLGLHGPEPDPCRPGNMIGPDA